jgi:hypothetical protein
VQGFEGGTAVLDVAMKWILRALAALFGVAALFELIAAAIGLFQEADKEASAALLVTGLITLLLAWGLWYWSVRADRANARLVTKRESIVREATAYLEAVSAAGIFPESPTERILSRPDAPVLAACNAKLLEVSSDQIRRYLGTRIKLAGVPIYLGQSSPTYRTVVRQTAEGELAVTPTSLIFDSPQRSVSVDLEKISALDMGFAEITVSAKGTSRPYTFVVPNGLLWGMLLKNLIQLKLKGRMLPGGAKLQFLR